MRKIQGCSRIGNPALAASTQLGKVRAGHSISRLDSLFVRYNSDYGHYPAAKGSVWNSSLGLCRGTAIPRLLKRSHAALIFVHWPRSTSTLRICRTKVCWPVPTIAAVHWTCCPPAPKDGESTAFPSQGASRPVIPLKLRKFQKPSRWRDIVGNRDVFALQVRGESMRDEHILDGDFVLVERTNTARSGEIVVALVRGSETTLKRYFREGSVISLQPANAEMDPILIPAAQVAIQGRVLGILRKY